MSSSSDIISNLFNKLPSDIIIDILSRLPVRQIIICKRVCKSWLRLVATHGFVKSHLSKSSEGLIVYQSDNSSNLYKYLELEDGVVEAHHLHYNLISNFKLPFAGWLYGSADGLLLLCSLTPIDAKPDDLFICNPITHEYVMLDSPLEFAYDNHVVTYGFGLSKTTRQYKVVRICHGRIFNQITQEWLVTSETECQAYTLGTGSWRTLASTGSLEYCDHISGCYFNGIIHWMVRDSNRCVKICCFDLETESFSTISAPRFPGHGRFAELTLFASGGCLGFCDNTSPYAVVIWTMKEYGVEQSWAMEVVMTKYLVDFDFGETTSAVFYPIKIFKDGDVLFVWKDFFLVYYSNVTRTLQEIDMFKVPPDNMLDAILYTPSFLSLRSFGFENVNSF